MVEAVRPSRASRAREVAELASVKAIWQGEAQWFGNAPVPRRSVRADRTSDKAAFSVLIYYYISISVYDMQNRINRLDKRSLNYDILN